MKTLFQDGEDKVYLDIKDILNIRQEELPMVVLSRNYYSYFATKISRFEHSVWNHFMWMVHPGKFLTQDWHLMEVPVENYLKGEHQLKFWHAPKHWSLPRRSILVKLLEKEEAKPWWKTRYDILQILGIKFHLRKLQIPWMRICSDWADYIKVVDSKFCGEHMTPGEVDNWLKDQGNYEVYGRFYPTD